VALNGGPVFAFTPAVSFVVNCDTQDEVDRLWQALSDGGQEGQCGWLTDRYGVSWQIVPAALGQMLNSADAAAAQRAFTAMLAMNKLDIAGLQRAYDGA
jgi:predicted 3-demethylubiquinone-9 3-methyltransferase (glyoxalase superfamily)